MHIKVIEVCWLHYCFLWLLITEIPYRKITYINGNSFTWHGALFKSECSFWKGWREVHRMVCRWRNREYWSVVVATSGRSYRYYYCITISEWLDLLLWLVFFYFLMQFLLYMWVDLLTRFFSGFNWDFICFVSQHGNDISSERTIVG